jgi:hypothetical protein
VEVRLDMTVSEDIRALADQGLGVAEIARRLGIRYQHAYAVLKRSGALPPRRSAERPVAETAGRARIGPKPPLSVEELVGGGFAFAGRWILADAGEIALDRPLPNAVGVYAFAMDGVVAYVGVATMGIARRLRFYAKPGSTQRTSRRLNHLIRAELATRPYLDIYTAVPGDLEWNGLPVHGSAGLELGLIRKYALPWNIRNAG